mmetsp:Transcript_171223/g.548963  ORF Transcript_171223/g.548963 Transcript_171223/m.548963 type:complete len:209 (-) Transcript_171223:337-963(-)
MGRRTERLQAGPRARRLGRPLSICCRPALRRAAVRRLVRPPPSEAAGTSASSEWRRRRGSPPPLLRGTWEAPRELSEHLLLDPPGAEAWVLPKMRRSSIWTRGRSSAPRTRVMRPVAPQRLCCTFTICATSSAYASRTLSCSPWALGSTTRRLRSTASSTATAAATLALGYSVEDPNPTRNTGTGRRATWAKLRSTEGRLISWWRGCG